MPKDRLPSDFANRHAALRDYFCDKDAAATAAEGGWALHMHWPGGVERHVDPRIDEGLAWWGGGVERATMALARRREGSVLRSLYDTWTLQSWSEWLSRQSVEPNPLTILHVDDHLDLGSPRLFSSDGQWLDGLTGNAVSLRDPVSVEASIESGAIGMGSFLTPFLHALPHSDVRLLSQPPKARATRDYAITCSTCADTLIEPGRARPAVSLLESRVRPGPGRLRITNSLTDWLTDLQPGPILLHIDMDYFNNRYDGDSDWQLRQEPLDPSLDVVCTSIDAMAHALIAHRLIDRIEDTVMAFSPGFFPGEFWGPADMRLKAALPSLYV